MGIFTPLIAELNQKNLDCSAPQSFKNYKKTHSISSTAMTASILSIDYLDRLDSELRENNLMVFRLGSEPGSNGTHFAIARAKGGFTDYFLDEIALEKNSSREICEPNISHNLEAFRLLPKLTESSLVNLSLASGILGNALGLDNAIQQHIPATCQSTFSFSVHPHQDISAEWLHRNGQVEIDALFCGSRRGKKELYIVESKFGTSHSSLAKHKLVYPYLAIREHLKEDISIVPVYLKTKIEGNSISFMVTECSFKGSSTAISSLKPLIIKTFILNNFLD
jgi:hypothetical protein